MHLMFQQYEERLHRRQAKTTTLKNFLRTAALFEESGLDPTRATDVDIEEWLAGLRIPRTKEDETQPTRGLAPRTVRLHYENLAAAYGYAVHRRLLPASPMEAVRLPREPDKEPRILTNDELRHILGNCVTDEQNLMMHLFIYTGMRRDEVRRLKWEDVGNTSLCVRAGKGDKLRHVPIHPALAEAIVATRPRTIHVVPGRGDNPLSDSGLFTRLDKVRGAVRCTFHDFRRTVATSLAEAEVSPNVIDKIMGWSPRTVGSRYYIRTADSRMQEAILRLYASDPLTVRGR